MVVISRPSASAATSIPGVFAAGDVTDEELLETENVGEMDLYCAVTNDDENNIMSSLLAKRMGARRVVALINRRAYADLLEAGRAHLCSQRVTVHANPVQAIVEASASYDLLILGTRVHE